MLQPILDLNDPVIAAIVEARVRLLLERPFFGTLATRLKIKDSSDWCKTAATDGRHLYYNREFIKSQTKANLLFLMGHEVLHCVYDHLGRCGDRDKKIWNMACDYIINYTLIKEDVGKMPDGGLFDERYTDMMTSEEVYDLLIANSTTVKMTLDEHLDGSGSGDDEDGEGGDGDGETTVRVLGRNGPPKLTEADMNDIRNEIRAATLQAAQSVGAGKTPAGVRRLINEFTHPKMDWRSLLETHIKSTIRDDYTFSRRNRHSSAISEACGSEIILPGSNTLDTIDIAVAIDTSGSMSDKMLKDFLGEVKGIMEAFGEFTISLWTFDTQVYGHKVFTAENLQDIMTYDPKGGGGTLFEVNWDHMKDMDLEPQRFIMFTDGYPGSTWGDPDYCDTLFVMHGTTSIVAPFGISCYYDAKED